MKILKIHMHRNIVLLILFFSALNILNSLFFKYVPLPMSENQILYIYSSLAQVIGALLGLTIAGYSVIDSKNKKSISSDNSAAEYIEEIQKEQFAAFAGITFLSLADLILCFLVLSSYRKYICFASWLMNESIIIFLAIITETIVFTKYLNPEGIKKLGSQDKAIYNDQSFSDESSLSLSQFITYYNLLEKIMKDYACELIDTPKSSYKITMTDGLNILIEHEIISSQTANVINELRHYRNAVVHSLDNDKSISTQMYSRIKNLYSYFDTIYTNRSKSQQFITAKQNLQKYVESLPLSNVETEILEYLKSNPNSTLQEISKHIGYTNRTTLNKLLYLLEAGQISRYGTGYKTTWKIYPHQM